MFRGEKEIMIINKICSDSQEWRNKLIAEIQRRNGRRKDPFKNNHVSQKTPEKDTNTQVMIRKIIENNHNQG